MTKKLLIIGLVWPEPQSSAAGSRMLQLIEQFKSQGFEIIFASAANKSSRSFDLSQLDVQCEVIALNDDSFGGFITNLDPNVVLFDRFITEEQFGWRVAEEIPKALRILDTEDFHGLRKGRQMAMKDGAPFSKSYLQNEITKREIASIYRCDLSLIISEIEMEILQDLGVKMDLLYYLPFLSNNPSEINKTSLSFEQREHFITIGNFLHPPNYEAVLYLKDEIWPLIRQQLPTTEVHIYGSYESQKVSQLHNEKDGFIIKGFANSVDEVMKQARICLAPLRFGAGLKGKLIDAMQNGTPCVMSTIAAEGMFGELPPNGIISTDTLDFALGAINLYNDKSQFQTFAQNGYKVLVERFNAKNFESNFADRISELYQRLDEHRQDNFLGQILHHKTLQSTKYLSKWIEAKNKNKK